MFHNASTIELLTLIRPHDYRLDRVPPELQRRVRFLAARTFIELWRPGLTWSHEGRPK